MKTNLLLHMLDASVFWSFLAKTKGKKGFDLITKVVEPAPWMIIIPTELTKSQKTAARVKGMKKLRQQELPANRRPATQQTARKIKHASTLKHSLQADCQAKSGIVETERGKKGCELIKFKQFQKMITQPRQW